ncbi:hypothetical protein DFH07DRAFT_773085 [Mycena maculata]|uniref:Epidermal growth factor receptor-like transmembrane-juxtamembrane segment domain-containing protein n=1 Tax=Mycena maculata TaxID=230809 RepID=A0AAD7NDZ7_9AGAR|nr:hypothetical protein DFH07DRAFT_773085 [Mycena maculata]
MPAFSLSMQPRGLVGQGAVQGGHSQIQPFHFGPVTQFFSTPSPPSPTLAQGNNGINGGTGNGNRNQGNGARPGPAGAGGAGGSPGDDTRTTAPTSSQTTDAGSDTSVSVTTAASGVDEAGTPTTTHLSPSASLIAANTASKYHNGKQKLTATSKPNTGAIAAGVVGGVVLLLLLALGVFLFLRRRRNRIAPSTEFLTVFPPSTPFRQPSFRSAASAYNRSEYSGTPPPMFEKKYTYTPPSLRAGGNNVNYGPPYP